jgi:structure-specific recognition protein 1
MIPFAPLPQVASYGGNYGDLSLKKKYLVMNSLSGKSMLDLKLDNVALCVVPISNRDEMEVHFHETDNVDREEDGLVQVTLHFPPGDDPEASTPAEDMRKAIMDTGVIRSVTGDIIAEFSKEQGNFVTPRGKYAIQMSSSYMHMQGAQYSYKIKYSDINSLFLLPKLDGGREAFVIALEKPIRQGNQKYQHLVLETHKIEHTMTINLTEDEIKTKYDGQLSQEMTMPMSHLIAKIFKVLSQTPVSVPRPYCYNYYSVFARDILLFFVLVSF